MTRSAIDLAKACFQAYADSDRAALEALVADELRFTSPLDHGIDRTTYFERCWPNHAQVEHFTFVHAVADGDAVSITYIGHRHDGSGFRNTERLRVRDGRITEVEVYFGWDVPHPAPAGGYVDA